MNLAYKKASTGYGERKGGNIKEKQIHKSKQRRRENGKTSNRLKC